MYNSYIIVRKEWTITLTAWCQGKKRDFDIIYTRRNQKMIKAGIIGATGYAGNEIVRLLLGHKDVEVAWYGSRSYIDKKYAGI